MAHGLPERVGYPRSRCHHDLRAIDFGYLGNLATRFDRQTGAEMTEWCSHFTRLTPVGVFALTFLVSGCSQSARTLPTTHSAPLPDTSLTLRGWSPVSLGDVQISVPSDWFVEDRGFVCGGGVQGMVFINQTPTSPRLGMGCPLSPTVIEMTTVSGALSNSHRTTVNSIPATEGTVRSGSVSTDVVRVLGMQIDARGPLGSQVERTITYSPLSVVLNRSVTSVPPGWSPMIFGGIRFSVPSQWRVERGTGWPGCPGIIPADVLELSTANEIYAGSCEVPPETAGYVAANPSMFLGSGPLIDPTPTNAKCISRSGLHICIDGAPSPSGGFTPGQELNVLIAQVTLPGQTTVDQIEIGLTGRGITPLEIFDSMKPDA